MGLGRYYHLAEIGVERNNHGHSTLNTLYTQLRYPRLYHHFAYDAGAGKRREVRLGWPTTPVTKPILVDDLIDAVNNGHLTIHSQGLVAECYTFILDEKGNAHGPEGKHDDRVLAAGVTWQIRKIPERRWSAQRPPGM